MYREQDKIDQTYSLIYKAPMEYYLLSCNHVTTISALIFGTYCTYRYLHRFDELSVVQKTVDFGNNIATMSETDVVYFAIGLVAMCASIRLILYKYPLRIYKNENKYTAIFEGHVPMMRQKVNFEKGAVKELPSTGLMPWKEHRHMMNDRSTIIFFEYFKVPAEYYNMMKPAKTPKTITK